MQEPYHIDYIQSLIIEYPPRYKTSFRYVSEPVGGRGKYYILINRSPYKYLLLFGNYWQRNEKSIGGQIEISELVSSSFIQDSFTGIEQSYPFESWILDGVVLPGTLVELSTSHLNSEWRDIFIEHTGPVYFHTLKWDAKVYEAQASLGMIAISSELSGKIHMLPELQESYAVLDWVNLHVDSKSHKIIKRIDEGLSPYILKVYSDPLKVLYHLQNVWKEKSWLRRPYRRLMMELALNRHLYKLKLWGVTLENSMTHEVIAGELGYTLGRTYTSLTGFFYRHNSAWNNLGKVQLILLAQLLKEKGISFWNLGHPYMSYKTKLGAQILSRQDFLRRWDDKVQADTIDIDSSFD
ncbi:hypothetical protein [Spirochaeta cellobiosiphila]|uniref:hypothetical protein n=1 Tax=Spirochaeta cellobiosiphila TaxID=504483 RepID=UPI000411BD00|nr:hypothetical protein [Spirochaeta cellobiosiphila]